MLPPFAPGSDAERRRREALPLGDTDEARVARRGGKRYCMPMRQPGRSVQPSPLLCAAFALLLAALPRPSAAEIQFDPPDERIRTTKVEATLKEKLASIQIYCFSKSARLFIDRKEIGWVPYRGDLEQGSHYLEVRIPGYYPLGHWFLLAEKTLYTLDFAPSRIVGSIELEAEPRDTVVLIDGNAASTGLSELPVGRHALVLRRFGYVERSLELLVREKQTERLSVSLEKAAFAIEGFGFSRESFNPRSVGVSSKVSLGFRAASYGSATVEIRGAAGGPEDRVVASFEFPAIEDWNQRRPWDGLGPEGRPLPDGLYIATLVASSPDSGAPIEAEARVWIDSSLVVRAFGAASALPGLLYMPDPVPAIAGTAAIEAFYFVPPAASWSSTGEGAFGLAAAFTVAKGVALGLHASAELGTAPFGSGDLDGSVLVALLGDKTTAWSGAFFFRGGYSSLSLPAMPGAGSLVEASLPVGARLGSIFGADARAALAPGLRADFSAKTDWLALGRAALWFEGPKFRAGLSGELPLSFDGGISLFRSAGTALEGRLMLGAFVAAAYATADFAPGEAPALGFGLGLGLLF
jgi:hypothetical protein